jgi:phage terminase small subunit
MGSPHPVLRGINGGDECADVCTNRKAMARPRTPATILNLRGAFDKDPQRKREDAEGAGPFETDPPTHLAQEVVPAWRYIVSRLPKVALSSSDEIAVEMAARLLAWYWLTGSLDHAKELRQWLAQLGMTPAARTKIPPAKPGEKGNRFAGLKTPSEA